LDGGRFDGGRFDGGRVSEAGLRLRVEPSGVRDFTTGETFLVAALLCRVLCAPGAVTGRWLASQEFQL
jgi:hypothetical protein